MRDLLWCSAVRSVGGARVSIWPASGPARPAFSPALRAQSAGEGIDSTNHNTIIASINEADRGSSTRGGQGPARAGPSAWLGLGLRLRLRPAAGARRGGGLRSREAEGPRWSPAGGRSEGCEGAPPECPASHAAAARREPAGSRGLGANTPRWREPPLRRCVVFDHDGTLVNSLAVVVRASNETLAAFGKAGDATAQLRTTLPVDPGFWRLRDAVAAYRQLAASGGWGSVPDGPKLELGDQGPRIDALRHDE